MPRGALALIMHSCEMPQGNYWGQKVAEAAVANLSRQDLVGIIEYSWQAGGEAWVLPLSEVGTGAAARRAIANLTFGDAPSFDSMMRMAIKDLEAANAGQKHCIIISDGDPTPPAQDVIARFQRAGVSVSTVMVFPHNLAGGFEWKTMQDIADATGGMFYAITQTNQLSRLPEIFIKEAQTVRRALIWEGDPFVPATSGLADAMRRIPTPVPPIRGYVVTADREGLSQVSLRAPTDDADPILASWQYGLGRSIAFTSDASTRWAASWVAWGSFRQFWEQHVRWAMRPGGSADIRRPRRRPVCRRPGARFRHTPQSGRNGMRDSPRSPSLTPRIWCSWIQLSSKPSRLPAMYSRHTRAVPSPTSATASSQCSSRLRHHPARVRA